MKINLTNLNKLAKMHEEGCDVQERVQHMIDTELELILQVLGSEYANEESVEGAREQLRGNDGWLILMSSIKNMTRQAREKFAQAKREADAIKLRTLEAENANIVRADRSIAMDRLRALASEKCFTHVGFMFAWDPNVPRIFPRKTLADILAACKQVKSLTAVVDSLKLVIQYETEKGKGRYRLDLMTSNEDECFLHLPVAA